MVKLKEKIAGLIEHRLPFELLKPGGEIDTSKRQILFARGRVDRNSWVLKDDFPTLRYGQELLQLILVELAKCDRLILFPTS
jgi:hypothetical protein